MNSEDIKLLQGFVKICQANPDVLHMPELGFYKTWLENMGARIPPTKGSPPHCGKGTCDAGRPCHAEEPPQPPPQQEEPDVEDSPESDLDIDDEGVIAPDNDVDQQMGDESIEVTDEMMEGSSASRDEAMSAVSEGNFELAVQKYSEAIMSNPLSANLYAKRASIYLKLQRPNAAIKDCEKALELNPDSAQPYKWRGKAYRLLGQWENAYRDLSKSCQLDYDDDTNEARREVEPKAKRVMEHKRKQERKKEERELRQRRERISKAKEECERKRKEQDTKSTGGGSFTGSTGPGAFFGGIPPDPSALFRDPELMQAFQDPELSAALQDILVNPANIAKYQNNPKLTKIFEKMFKNFKGGPDPGDVDGNDIGSSVPESGRSSAQPNVPPQPDID